MFKNIVNIKIIVTIYFAFFIKNDNKKERLSEIIGAKNRYCCWLKIIIPITDKIPIKRLIPKLHSAFLNLSSVLLLRILKITGTKTI